MVSAKTVVIADDTGFVRDRFKSALEEGGHRAIAVRSAVELLARVRADLDRIDLIALDLRLPNAPGVDLVRAIRTTSPLDAASSIKVRFRMPGSKRDIDAEGRVAWSDRRVGMGLQFEHVDPADQAAIDGFVDAHFFSNRRA